jgi:hypothetical protein
MVADYLAEIHLLVELDVPPRAAPSPTRPACRWLADGSPPAGWRSVPA